MFVCVPLLEMNCCCYVFMQLHYKLKKKSASLTPNTHQYPFQPCLFQACKYKCVNTACGGIHCSLLCRNSKVNRGGGGGVGGGVSIQ